MSEQSIFYESILNYQELVPIDSLKLLRQIDRVFIHKDNMGKEIFLITKSDQVFGFGRNYYGRLGFGNTNEVKEPTIIPELCGKSVKNIKTGSWSSVALTQSGQIYTFGYNINGVTGNGDNILYNKPNVIAIDNQLITAIDCTGYSTHLLTQTGQLYWFGYFYQLVNQKEVYIKALIPTKVIIPSGEKIKNICCGSDHILALTESGKVFAWGRNNFGQLGLSHNNFTDKPKLIDFRENLLIKQISCGYNHSIVLTTDERIYSTGDNSSGQLGIGNKINQNRFKLVLTEQKEICCFENFSMSLDINNKLYIWGKIKAEVVSPVLSGFRSFQEVINTYADHCCTPKPLSSVELFKNMPSFNLIKTMSKLFDNAENSDLKFKVKCRGSDNQFKYIFGHKCIIKETSEYIKTMIDNQNNSNQTTGPISTTPSTSTELTTFCRNCYKYETIEIAINEYSYEAVYQYIKSLYTDFIDSEDMEELLEILSITQKYSDFDKKDECVELIKRLTKLENVCSVFSGAIKFRSDILRDFAFEMMSKRIDELIETTDYKNLEPTYAMVFHTEYQLMQRKK